MPAKNITTEDLMHELKQYPLNAKICIGVCAEITTYCGSEKMVKPFYPKKEAYGMRYDKGTNTFYITG